MSLLTKFRALFGAAAVSSPGIDSVNAPSEELFQKLDEICQGYPEISVLNATTNILAGTAVKAKIPRKNLLWEVGAAWHKWKAADE